MPVATPEQYAEMLDRAKAGGFAYPAFNASSSQSAVMAPCTFHLHHRRRRGPSDRQAGGFAAQCAHEHGHWF